MKEIVNNISLYRARNAQHVQFITDVNTIGTDAPVPGPDGGDDDHPDGESPL